MYKRPENNRNADSTLSCSRRSHYSGIKYSVGIVTKKFNSEVTYAMIISDSGDNDDDDSIPKLSAPNEDSDDEFC